MSTHSASIPIYLHHPTLKSAQISLAELFKRFAGFLVFGLCCGLGSLDWFITLRMIPSALFLVLGTLFLSCPVLLVGHHFFQFRAQTEDLVASIVRSVVVGGQLALGLSGIMLFFSATTHLWILATSIAMAGIGFVMAMICVREVREQERNARIQAGIAASLPTSFNLWITGWILLVFAIATRLAWSLATFVLMP